MADGRHFESREQCSELGNGNYIITTEVYKQQILKIKTY